jgi:hypothetical protein
MIMVHSYSGIVDGHIQNYEHLEMTFWKYFSSDKQVSLGPDGCGKNANLLEAHMYRVLGVF